MVMKPEPLVRAIEAAKIALPDAHVVLLTPSGKVFSQNKALELSRQSNLILVCGRYEGVDQRVIELVVDEELSIGDYVLMGGEIPAMVIIEASVRLLQDVIGNPRSLEEESFSGTNEECLLEAPHYTKPAEFRSLKVPEVLLSGNHGEIAKWRRAQAVARTNTIRPELMQPGNPRRAIPSKELKK